MIIISHSNQNLEELWLSIVRQAIQMDVVIRHSLALNADQTILNRLGISR